MLFIVISMAVIVAVAALVVTFVAFPHRGEEVPGANWLGDGMNKIADALPTLEDDPTGASRSIIEGGHEPQDHADVPDGDRTQERSDAEQG